jgi:CheY-like chemotaxis protein
MDSISPSTAPSILLVEEDTELRKSIIHALIRAGDEAAPASDAKEALDLMAAAVAQPKPKNSTAARIKPASSFVYLS